MVCDVEEVPQDDWTTKGYSLRGRLPDGRRLTVTPVHQDMTTLAMSPKPPLLDVIFDSWDFPTYDAACQAFYVWNPEQEPEPDGWHRHIATNRYRINGQADLEYIKLAGPFEEAIARAVRLIEKKDLVI